MLMKEFIDKLVEYHCIKFDCPKDADLINSKHCSKTSCEECWREAVSRLEDYRA